MNKEKILICIFSFCMILSIFISSIEFVCFDRNFYNSEHSKLKLNNQSISEYIGVSDDELKVITDILLEYTSGKIDSLDYQTNINNEKKEVFNNKEKQHMVDVRNLYLNTAKLRNVLLLTGLILFIMMYINKRLYFPLLFNEYKKFLVIFLMIILILSIFILTDFDSFWTKFHHIFFSSNDLWLLDLRKDILIMIVPPKFFNHLCIRIVLIVILSIFFFTVLLYFVSKRFNDDKYCVV